MFSQFSIFFLSYQDFNIARSKTNTKTSVLKLSHMSRDMTKLTKWVCAQRRLRSAWASAQSDHSAVRMKKPCVFSYPLSAHWCPGWSESSLGAHSFCWFCHVGAHMQFWFYEKFCVSHRVVQYLIKHLTFRKWYKNKDNNSFTLFTGVPMATPDA